MPAGFQTPTSSIVGNQPLYCGHWLYCFLFGLAFLHVDPQSFGRLCLARPKGLLNMSVSLQVSRWQSERFEMLCLHHTRLKKTFCTRQKIPPPSAVKTQGFPRVPTVLTSRLNTTHVEICGFTAKYLPTQSSNVFTNDSTSSPVGLGLQVGPQSCVFAPRPLRQKPDLGYFMTYSQAAF